MTWHYSQSTRVLSQNGRQIGIGYSGRGTGKNNPQMQGVQDIGPTPRGLYSIGAPFHHPKTGDYTMRLTASSGTDTLGRGGFMIHGDSKAHPGDASHGCIILRRTYREAIWKSGDHSLQVGL